MDQTVRRLKIGIHLPEIERVAPWTDILEMARRAEALGFDSLWVPDHLLYRIAGQPTRAPWECWSILSALAAVTERIELGTLVAATAFRNPALLAKTADTIDEISGGRLILGLGAGGHEPEFRAFGFPYDHRFSRFEEAFTIIRTLLREGRIDFAGRFYQARDCELCPRGPRRHGPPIMIGTRGDRMLQVAARDADLWNGWAVWIDNRVENLPPLLATVDAACSGAQRDPATLERTFTVFVLAPGHTPAEASDVGFRDPPLIAGTPEAIAENLRAYAAAGISHLQILLTPNTAEAITAFAPVLELLDRGVRRTNR